MAEAKGADTEDAKSKRWIDEVGTRQDGFNREAKGKKIWGTEQNSRRRTRGRRREEGGSNASAEVKKNEREKKKRAYRKIRGWTAEGSTRETGTAVR